MNEIENARGSWRAAATGVARTVRMVRCSWHVSRVYAGACGGVTKHPCMYSRTLDVNTVQVYVLTIVRSARSSGIQESTAAPWRAARRVRGAACAGAARPRAPTEERREPSTPRLPFRRIDRFTSLVHATIHTMSMTSRYETCAHIGKLAQRPMLGFPTRRIAVLQYTASRSHTRCTRTNTAYRSTIYAVTPARRSASTMAC